MRVMLPRRGYAESVTSTLIERAQTGLRDRDRVRVLVGEVIRFGVVGVVGFGIDIAGFNVLRHFGVGPLSSKAASTSVAAVASYVLNRHWSFAHRARRSTRRELFLFLLLSAVGLGIAETCLAISHYGLDHTSRLADNVSANGIGLVLGSLWRFWSFKRWVFTKHPERAGEALVNSPI